ncbi:hypothetical protein [Candidatus Vallotia cooleyia]|nr:hypothetical protein [Candidatus Vallotia cooleyia]
MISDLNQNQADVVGIVISYGKRETLNALSCDIASRFPTTLTI